MASYFNGRKYLVTGAGRGLGRTVAENLANRGAKVFALDCVKENLDDLGSKIPEIVLVHQDLTNWDETAEKVGELGDFDGLVNCAAIFEAPKESVDVAKETLSRFEEVILNAPINLMQVVGKKMIASRNGGSIVNISSTLSKGALPGVLAYSVSKAGLDMATKVFALELGQHKIRVNAVHPGLMSTDLTRPAHPEEVFQMVASNTPLRRLVDLQNVADLVLFLLSDHSVMITGTIHTIDGGLTCKLP